MVASVPDRIRDNIDSIRARIARAAARAGTGADKIELIAVTKFQPIESMYAAVECGIAILGENRVQERADKASRWDGRSAAWHMIGRLQRNKARKAVGLFDCIQSIDGFELAVAIERIIQERTKSEDGAARGYPVMVEVNTSGEETKGGVAPRDCADLVERIAGDCPHLTVEGLMTIGPLAGGDSETRASFALLRSLADVARKRTGLGIPHLSMGMSGDFEAAVEEGGTMVRIGTGIFGARHI
ncbi:MAG: YggS family pyridoxal phosphate-dependent enzyme [Synergistaceae bacterium]|jgi:pyridoxal phosphate enzyme (YggS family)|nr:YggS family pyridoxal phosphate-dependent enzyme [Synergistaceae bacterium]